MKRLSDTQRRNIEDAVKALEALDRTGASAQAKIEHLKLHFGARFVPTGDGRTLVCAGIRSSSTWSDGFAQLSGWLQLARRRLCRAATLPADEGASHG